MTSAAHSVASPPPSGATEVFFPSEPTCCVVQLRHQRDGVVHQVTLDPAKVKGPLVRLGDWPGDEACGWQRISNIAIIVTLGRAERVSATELRVTP